MNPGESIVSIETFGSILDSFGPLKAAYMSKGRPVTAMDRVCSPSSLYSSLYYYLILLF